MKLEDVDDDNDVGNKDLLSPEDAVRQGELAEGVRKIKVRRLFRLLPEEKRDGLSEYPLLT